LRAAPAEDDVRTQGGVLGIGRWPHAKVAPRPSAENLIDYADLAHVASAGVVVGYLVDEGHASAVAGGGWRHVVAEFGQFGGDDGEFADMFPLWSFPPGLPFNAPA
jgi:hypothetical protein